MKSLSIIIPVRKESELIHECLSVLRQKTVSFDDVEVLCATAQGDKMTENIVYSYYPLARAIPVDQSKKYLGLHDYTNALVKEAEGKLIWWLADDVRIKTLGYDQLLKPYAKLYGDKVYYFASMADEGGGNAFPILTKKWLDITGHWSDDCRIDSWVNTIIEKFPKQRVISPIYGLYIEVLTVTGKVAPMIYEKTEWKDWDTPGLREETDKLLAEIQREVVSL